ncbi:hypothetical protein ACIA2T_24775 [Amycolatopsis japonica]|uniref:hypothetical protein n=1 Tax=Amycolatopsis japonica TaxID=208439 RepID=UPI0037A5C3D0
MGTADNDAPLDIFPVAIGEYQHHQNLPVDAEVSKVVQLLADYGGAEVPWEATLARDEKGVSDRLRRWAATSGYSFLYWVGHGDSNGLRAALAHTSSPKFIGEEGISPERLTHHIISREPHRDEDAWTVVVIEACKSARFVQLLSAAVDAAMLDGERRLLLIGVSSGEASTTLGRFSAALETALKGIYLGAEEIGLWDLAGQLQRNLPGSEIALKHLGDAVLRRSRPVPRGLAVPLDVLAEVEAVLEDLTIDERRHFIPKAQGGELGEVSWYFEGRARERLRIAKWLRDDSHGLLVVTGRAGSGKSALLGHLLVQSRPALRTVLTAHGLVDPLAGDERPPDDVFGISLHLTGLTSSEVVDRLAAEFRHDRNRSRDVHSTTVPELLRFAARAPTAILLDALDESFDPVTIARSVLRPLARVPGVKILVGTRSSTWEHIDRPAPDDRDILDALDVTDSADDIVVVTRDPTAIGRYARKRMLTAVRDQRIQATQGEIERFGSALEKTNHEFLFARLAIFEVLASPAVLTEGLGDLLASDHQRLFANAVTRLTDLAPVNGALLRAIGLAQGRGLPIRDGIWADLAEAVADRDDTMVHDNDIAQLLIDAAPYLMLDSEHEQTVYRLAHRTFQEYFAAITPDQSRGLHNAVAVRLMRHAKKEHLNAYAASYTSSHVGEAGRAAWELLASDGSVLDRLDPLAVAADAMRTAFGRFQLPDEIAGVIGAQHLLANAPTAHHTGLRQLATARHSDEPLLSTRSSEPSSAAWTVQWAGLVHQPLHRTILAHSAPLIGLAVLARGDGTAIVLSGSTDSSVRVWDPITGAEAAAPFFSDHAISALAGIPEPNLLAIGDVQGRVRIWNPLSTAGPLAQVTGQEPVTSLTALPGGRQFAVGRADGLVEVIDLSNPSQPVRKWRSPHPISTLAAFNRTFETSEQTWLAIGSEDGTAVLVDLFSGRVVEHAMPGHAAPVAFLFASPALGKLLSVDGAGIVRAWNTSTLIEDAPRMAVRGSAPGPVTVLPTSSDDAVVAIGTARGQVTLQQVGRRHWTPGRVTDVLTGHTGQVNALTTIPSAQDRTLLLVSGADDGTVRIWNAGLRTTGDDNHSYYVQASAVAAYGRPAKPLIVTAGVDGSLSFWNGSTGTSMGRASVSHGGATALASDRLDKVFVGTRHGALLRYDTSARRTAPPIAESPDPITQLSYLPEHDALIFLDAGGQMKLLRLHSGRAPVDYSSPKLAFTALSILPAGNSGSLMVGSDTSGRLHIFHPLTGTIYSSFRVGQDEVRSITYLPGTDTKLAVGTSNSLEIWDPFSRRHVENIHAAMSINALDSSSRGRIFAASSDGLLSIMIKQD